MIPDSGKQVARSGQGGSMSPWERWPRRTRWIIVGVWIAAALVALVALTHPRLDSAMTLVAVTIAVLVSVLVPYVAYVRRLDRPPLQRFLLLLAPWTPLALLFAFFETTDVTGSLVPRFRARWTSARTTPALPAPPTSVGPDTSAPRADLATTTVDDYPQFRGPHRNQSVDGVQFATNWDEQPPKLLWKQPIGAGWSAFAAVNGYAVTQEQREDQEVTVCYEVATGRQVWANAIPARHETYLGGLGPRSTPVIEGGRVHVLGATGVLRCLNGEDGTELWRHDLLAEQGVTNDLAAVAWGRASSPLVVDDLVIVPVGGPADGQRTTVAAFDKTTGELRWRAGDLQVSYASPVPAELAGVRQVLVIAENALLAVTPERGEVLWSHDWPGSSTAAANVSDAVPVDAHRVFISKGYGYGAALLHVDRSEDGSWEVREEWSNPSVMKTKFSNVVLHEEHIYGMDDIILECLEVGTGRKAWKQGRFGYGQLLRVGETLVVQSESGELTCVRITSDSFQRLGAFQALDGKCWNNLCLHGRHLLVRNDEEAACYELPGWQRLETQPGSAAPDR